MEFDVSLSDDGVAEWLVLLCFARFGFELIISVSVLMVFDFTWFPVVTDDEFLETELIIDSHRSLSSRSLSLSFLVVVEAVFGDVNEFGVPLLLLFVLDFLTVLSKLEEW